MNEFFKYENYKKFLIFIRDRYFLLLFAEQGRQDGILLRHDVDYSVEKAYRMALVEKMCGIKSTYFVMISSYLYNPFAEENKRMLCKMALLGFEIGLHFDSSIYSKDYLEEAVHKEVKLLQFVTDKPVSSISLHNPGVCEDHILFDAYINAYDNSICSDEVYMSDSCMDFRGKDPYEFVKRANNTVIQILLHPCYYTNS